MYFIVALPFYIQQSLKRRFLKIIKRHLAHGQIFNEHYVNEWENKEENRFLNIVSNAL
jgi:hypothetical protein